MPFGLGPRDLLGLVRETQAGTGLARPVLVRGPRAAELCAALTEGGDPRLATTTGDGTGASAIVLSLETQPVSAEVELLRRATRAGVPVIALKLQPFPEAVAYVLAEDVLDDPADSELPTAAVAAAIVRGLPDRGAALAARLPIVREAAVERQSRESAVTAGTLAAFTDAGAAVLPALALAQAKAMTKLETSAGAPVSADPAVAARTAGQNLGAAVAVGLACRSLVRRLPVRGRLVEGAVAAAGTYALLRLHRARTG